MIRGDRLASTAEELMRSRYTAHAKTEVDYVYETTHSSQRKKVNREQVAAWSKNSEWLGLEIDETEGGGPDDDAGSVTFTARYREKGKKVEHREVAEFKKEDGRWYFVDGRAPKAVQVIRQGPKIGRNDPCTCGSGKKFKKCCGA
jgi:SEC-C motif-containing protein